MADTRDLKSLGSNPVRVRVPPWLLENSMDRFFKILASNGQASLLRVKKPVAKRRDLTTEAVQQGVLPPNAKVKRWRELSAMEYAITLQIIRS
jgi:hypothetical protein